MDRLRAAIARFKTCFFFVKPLRKDMKFEWQLYWRTGRPFCLLLQAPECISIHVARRYIVHMRIFITGRRPRLRAIVCLKVGMTL